MVEHIRTQILDETAVATKLCELAARGGSAKFAVAFWGDGAETMLSLDDFDDVKIICNLRSGGTNPQVIASLREQGYEVRQLDDLHAKLYWTEHGAIIGSSNASANGLSLEGKEARGWYEANVFSAARKFRDDAEQLFLDLWQVSDEILPGDLNIALERWERRREQRASGTPRSQRSLLEAALRSPHEVGPNPIAVCVYDDEGELSKDAKDALKIASKQLRIRDDELDCYEEKSDDQRLAPGTVVVDLPINRRGKPSSVTLYQILEKDPYRDLPSNEHGTTYIQLMRVIKKVPSTNLSIGRSEVKLWKKAGELYRSSGRSKNVYDPIPHLQRFARFIGMTAAKG